MKRILIIAGPNGAGKTTAANKYLPNEGALRSFLNADLIAAGLSPFNPEAQAVRAGRIMLEMMDDLVEREQSFSFETTLSGRGYSGRIKQGREAGYQVRLVFLRLPNPEAAILRVRNRIKQGGHSIS
jgi:predicted ABC-type ATPase